MNHYSLARVVALVATLAFLLTACTQTTPKNPEELLLGDWMWEGLTDILQFTPEGTWRFGAPDLLDCCPQLNGTYSFDGTTISMVVASDASDCRGYRFEWQVTKLDEITLVAEAYGTCGYEEGQVITMYRCDANKEPTTRACEPVSWEAVCEAREHLSECNLP